MVEKQYKQNKLDKPVGDVNRKDQEFQLTLYRLKTEA